MKAVRLHAHDGAAGLVVEDAPEPTPARGEVLVRVPAAAVSPTELGWVPTSTTRTGAPRPLVPGHEFSGVVTAIGPGVRDLAAGDAVFGMNDWYGKTVLRVAGRRTEGP